MNCLTIEETMTRQVKQEYLQISRLFQGNPIEVDAIDGIDELQASAQLALSISFVYSDIENLLYPFFFFLSACAVSRDGEPDEFRRPCYSSLGELEVWWVYNLSSNLSSSLALSQMSIQDSICASRLQ